MARADKQSPTYKKEERYSDFVTDFIRNPVTGNLAKVSNEESVKQALKNLILTNLGERFYNPYAGSTVKASLFDPADAFTADQIRMSIVQAISQNEPRVNVLDVRIGDLPDQNAYSVQIVFTLINIGEPINLDLIIKRVR